MDRGYGQADGEPVDPGEPLYRWTSRGRRGVYGAAGSVRARDRNRLRGRSGGVSKGLVNLQFARHLESTNAATDFDDGWFGYGSFKAPAAPKPVVASASRAVRARGRARQTAVDDDPDRPHLIRKPGSEGDDASCGDGTRAGELEFVSRQLRRTAGSDGGGDDDPDRPHLTRKPDSSGTGRADGEHERPGAEFDRDGVGRSDSGGTGSNPADDPDRPTLKKRTPEQQKQARKEADHASVSGESTSLNEDPDRPKLQRGVPTHAADGGRSCRSCRGFRRTCTRWWRYRTRRRGSRMTSRGRGRMTPSGRRYWPACRRWRRPCCNYGTKEACGRRQGLRRLQAAKTATAHDKDNSAGSSQEHGRGYKAAARDGGDGAAGR